MCEEKAVDVKAALRALLSRYNFGDPVLESFVSGEIIDFYRILREFEGVPEQISLNAGGIAAYGAEIRVLKQRIQTLQDELLILEENQRKLSQITPLGASEDDIQVLVALTAFVRNEIAQLRGYMAERSGIAEYQLPFLEKFVLPALEGRLTSNWWEDSMWEEDVDIQLVNPLPRDRLLEKQPWLKVWCDLRMLLSLERVQALVGVACDCAQYDVWGIKTLIDEVRLKRQRE